MTRIRAVIVDDEPLTRERVRALLATEPDVEVVGEARNGLEALGVIAQASPDLLFLDVEMPELDGFGVIAELEGDEGPVVVFITAFERYALKAFDVGAVDYLHKPITRERFAAAMTRARERIAHRSAAQWQSLVTGAAAVERSRGHRERYVIHRGGTHYFLAVNDIDWIEAADNYLSLHAGGRAHLCRGTMKHAEEELDPARFLRVHRSTIVATGRVVSVAAIESGGLALTMRDGSIVRVSRQFAGPVRKRLGF